MPGCSRPGALPAGNGLVGAAQQTMQALPLRSGDTVDNRRHGDRLHVGVQRFHLRDCLWARAGRATVRWPREGFRTLAVLQRMPPDLLPRIFHVLPQLLYVGFQQDADAQWGEVAARDIGQPAVVHGRLLNKGTHTPRKSIGLWPSGGQTRQMHLRRGGIVLVWPTKGMRSHSSICDRAGQDPWRVQGTAPWPALRVSCILPGGAEGQGDKGLPCVGHEAVAGGAAVAGFEAHHATVGGWETHRAPWPPPTALSALGPTRSARWASSRHAQPVSDPNATSARPEATAAALPPDEPPATQRLPCKTRHTRWQTDRHRHRHGQTRTDTDRHTHRHTDTQTITQM